MKRLFIFIFSISSLYSCDKAEIKLVNGVFTDEFEYMWNSPWIDKSKELLDYEEHGKFGFKIKNISRRIHTGIVYNDFPINLMGDFEANLKFIMYGEDTFAFFIGYKDPRHRESFTFSKQKKRFSYTRYRGQGSPLRLVKPCNVKNKKFNRLKIIKKNNELFVYLNGDLLMKEKNLPSFSNSIGIGLGPITSVYLRKIEIIETNFKE